MPRNLRVLVIDDRASWVKYGIGSRYLDVLEMPYKEGEPLRALTGWSQHLWLWRENRFPGDDADIVLIDCKFEGDNTAPTLDEQDPRGLLHGAVYLARLFGRKRNNPFGFNVYTQHGPALKDDPYAQTFLGFILAMADGARGEDSPEELYLPPSNYSARWPDACKAWLASSAKQTPETAWGPAVEMYRAQLEAAFAKGAYLIRRESWDDAVAALRLSPAAAGVSLAWLRNDGSADEVYLESLFADSLDGDAWSERVAQKALEWLHGLTIPDINFLDTTVYWLNRLFVKRGGRVVPEVVIPDLPRGSLINPHRPDEAVASYTNFAHACACVVCWVMSRWAHETAGSGILVERIGLQPKQADRYFTNVAHMTWGEVVDSLDNSIKGKPGMWNWPFPYLWQVKMVVRAWWEKTFPNEPFPFR